MIARWAAAAWDGERTYVAEPRRVLQAHHTAPVIADRGTTVVRRGRDGTWRYAIALLALEDGRPGSGQ